MHPEWLSNAYLVADEPGGHGVIIDSGAPAEPLLEAIERHDVTVEQLLLTHHHHDHVAENNVFKGNKSFGNTEHDCHDDSTGTGTGGTANTWKDNKGATENKPDLCKGATVTP